MKHLIEYVKESINVFEAISLDAYRGFLKEFGSSGEDEKLKEQIQSYKDAFWDALKLIPGAKENRNHHRIYIPYNEPISLSANIEQLLQYATTPEERARLPVEAKVRKHIDDKLAAKGDKIIDWQYRDGVFTVEVDTQQGKKERQLKIGKFLNDNKDLLNAYASDPTKLTKNIEHAKKLICISDHAYDIAGMSTGRKWTSCMNILNGSNKEWAMRDIEYGTLVAYIILEEDTNIEAPLGRVLIKPYKLMRKDYHGTDPSPIVYSPEPTVYSTYVGMEGVIDYLNKICQEYQPYQGTLKKMKQIYYDTFFAKKDLKFNVQ